MSLLDDLRTSPDERPRSVRGYVLYQPEWGWDDELMAGIGYMLTLGYDIVLVPIDRGHCYCPTIPNPQRAATFRAARNGRNGPVPK
jgi:hypothetical protein